MAKNNKITTSSFPSLQERVRVAIRIRPLNSNERIQGHQNIIQKSEVKDNTLIIWDPLGLEATSHQEYQDIDVSCWARSFTFDHCFYSEFNSQEEEDDGGGGGEGRDEQELYQSQEEVFNTIGQPVVDWALDGYNSCVLAYGQTGAG